MITIKDVQAEGSEWQISLTKLTGKQIKDIVGYVTMEFGDPVFKVSQVVLEDGTTMWFEGEHDLPYLTNGATDQPNMDEETLERLYDEGHDEDE